MTDSEHQQWKKDLEELHNLRAKNKILKEAISEALRRYNDGDYSQGDLIFVLEHALKGE